MMLRVVLSVCLGSALSLVAGCAGSNEEVREAPIKKAPAIAAPADAPGPTDADAPKEFSTTGSGLKYRILRKSDQPKPLATDHVTVNYRGTLDDGKEFDSSYGRGQPATFPLNRVVKGWTEGLQLVGEGGMIELEIPSSLGYGPDGSPPTIPPDATLHFIVELIKIN